MIIENNILERVEETDIVHGTVEIPNYIEKIEAFAFKELDALEYINLLQHIKCVGIHAFLDCKHLKSVMFFNDNCKIGAGLFAGCEELRVVRFPQNLNKNLKNIIFKEKQYTYDDLSEYERFT